MTFLRSNFARATACIALLLPATHAAPLVGTFDIGGSSATVTAVALQFLCNVGITRAAACPANSGNFSIPTATGGFTPYIGQGGYIQSISVAGGQPINTAFSLPNWLMLSSTAGNPVIPPDFTLELQFIFEGTDPQAAIGTGACGAGGTFCTPVLGIPLGLNDPTGISPYNLQNTAGGGSTASFVVSGLEHRISTGETAPFVGTFTAQFSVPYQTLLAQLATPGGSITNSYSATFSITTVPEPDTAWAFAGGLLVLLSLGMRRYNQAKR